MPIYRKITEHVSCDTKESTVLAMKLKLTLSYANQQTNRQGSKMYFALAYGVTCKKLCSYVPESEHLQHYHVTFSKPRLSRHILQDKDVALLMPPKCSRTRGYILAPNYRGPKLSDHSFLKPYYYPSDATNISLSVTFLSFRFLLELATC